MAEKWVTIREASVTLNRTRRTLRRWVERGKLQIDRSQYPALVDIAGHLRPPGQDASPPLAPPVTVDSLQLQVAGLTAEVDRLQERLTEMREERDDWKRAHYMALANVQQLTERAGERPRRSWRWPWQRGD